jgi:hypothetical protein
VLLSHNQHGPASRVLLDRVPLVLTTSDSAARLGGVARALLPWYHLSLDRPDDGTLCITGVPARHGPVIGFVPSGVDVPTLYVSGDNTSLDVVREVSSRLDPAIVIAAGECTSL